MRRLDRRVWLPGLTFGVLTVAADVLMALQVPQGGQPAELTGPLLFTFCMSYLVSGIFYGLSGYVGAGITGSRSQGQVSGLISAALDGTLGALIIAQLPGSKASPADMALGVLVGLLLNLPIGFVFGSFGAGWGSRTAR